MEKIVFSEWLQEQMDLRNWTQADLAKATGLTRTAISSYLNQRRTKPDPEALLVISKVFHIDPINLFKIIGFLPNDHGSKQDFDLSNWKELLSKLSKRDQELLRELAIKMIEKTK